MAVCRPRLPSADALTPVQTGRIATPWGPASSNPRHDRRGTGAGIGHDPDAHAVDPGPTRRRRRFERSSSRGWIAVVVRGGDSTGIAMGVSFRLRKAARRDSTPGIAVAPSAARLDALARRRGGTSSGRGFFGRLAGALGGNDLAARRGRFRMAAVSLRRRERVADRVGGEKIAWSGSHRPPVLRRGGPVVERRLLDARLVLSGGLRPVVVRYAVRRSRRGITGPRRTFDVSQTS